VFRVPRSVLWFEKLSTKRIAVVGEQPDIVEDISPLIHLESQMYSKPAPLLCRLQFIFRRIK